MLIYRVLKNQGRMNSKMRIGYGAGLPVLLLVSMLTWSCKEEIGNNEAPDNQAHLIVRLTDGPGHFQEVNIDIEDIQVNAGDDDSGWKSIDTREGIYDLLKLRNGLDTLLAEIDLPAGKISQIRLVLSDDNTVRVKNKLEDLSTPSAQQSGLKVQVHMDLQEGKRYEILLDFDAARSIVPTGPHGFNLKPVIRAIVEEQGQNQEPGSIGGRINPVEAMPTIYAILGADTVSTTANNEGEFLIQGLDGGSYRVVFIPEEGFLQEELTDVEVDGGLTDLGVIIISRL